MSPSTLALRSNSVFITTDKYVYYTVLGANCSFTCTPIDLCYTIILNHLKNHEYIFGRIKLILTLNCKLPPTECTLHTQNNYMKCRYCTRVTRESKQQENKKEDYNRPQ